MNTHNPFHRALKQPLILASASPRRHRILQDAGLQFTIQVSEAEPEPLAGSDPAAFAVRAASEKALDVAQDNPGQLVIGADTIVVLDGQILGKPDSEEEAAKMLATLSGQEHQVITGFAIAFNDGTSAEIVEVDYESSDVKFRKLSQQQILDYVNTKEPMDKAGSYAVQGRGGELVSGVEGSYLNVVGLPLARLQALLDRIGYRGPNSH